MGAKGAPCNALTKVGKYGQKALWAYGTAEQSEAGINKLANGDIIGGILDLAQAGVSARRMMQSCFVAGTPWRGVEQGDRGVPELRAWRRVRLDSELERVRCVWSAGGEAGASASPSAQTGTRTNQCNATR